LRSIHRLLLAVPVLLVLYLYGLDRVGIIGPDEPRYASIGREMALSGDWVTPTLWGQAWFEKPALLYWLIGLGYRSGLPAEVAARAPVAILSVAFLLLFFRQLQREFGECAAVYATALLATSVGWLAYSLVAVTDLPMAAFFSGSMLLALPWVRSGGRRGFTLAGAFLGLAVLAKGLVPIVLALPLYWIGRRRWKDLMIYTAAAAATTAPWYVACYLRNGQVFVDEFIWKHHVGRFFTSELQHVQPFWFFVPVLAGLLFPWTPLLALLRRIPDWREPSRLLLILWAAFGFVFFSASTNKLPGYVLPLLPPLCALMGMRLAAGVPARALLTLSAASLALLPVAAATLPGALAEGLSDAFFIQVQALPALSALGVAAAVFFLETSNRRYAAVALTCSAAAAGFLAVKHWTLPAVDATATARLRWLAMAGHQQPCIAEASRTIRYGLNYYAGRALPDCSATRERPLSVNHDNLDRN
jgi:4-amino-4-deoxy-L-arabinose transferase-like glycosyltransferase